MNKLKEDFSVKGTKMEDFKQEIKEMDARTKFRKEFMGNLTVATYCGPNQYLVHQEMCCGQATTVLNNLKNLHIVQLPQNSEFQDDIQNAGFILLNDNHTYVISPKAVKTFGKRLGIGGEEFTIPGITRDLYISRQIHKHSSDICTLIVRTYAGTEKIFAVMSGQYRSTKQEFLCEILEQIDGECYKWSIDNTMTRFHLDLPSCINHDLPEIIPGIILHTSDVGEASLSVQPVWRINETVVKGQEMRLPHTANVPFARYMQVVKNAINKLELLPHTLMQLQNVNVSPKKMDKLQEQLKMLAGKKNTLKLVAAIKNATTAYEACMGIYRYQISMKDSVAEKYGTLLYSLPQIFKN